MARPATTDDMADVLYDNVSLLARRLHHAPTPSELSLPERSALARLDRGGPNTAANLARSEQITPQAMAGTLAALEKRGLVTRRSDPEDRRRIIVALTDNGRDVLRHKRHARGQQLAAALGEHFTPDEIGQLRKTLPLIKRLAEHL